MLADVAAETVTDEVSVEVAAQLQAGHDAEYTALLTQEGIIMAAQSVGEDSVSGMRAVIGRDEAAGIEYLATEDGIVAHGIDVNPEGATEGVVAAAFEEQSVADDSPDT